MNNFPLYIGCMHLWYVSHSVFLKIIKGEGNIPLTWSLNDE